jgi:hypothetical protein
MTTTQAQYVTELERTAQKTIATPVSFTGGFKLIWPLAATESTGWARLGRRVAVGALVGCWWLLVTVLWYALLTSFLFLWAGWLIYTQARRHRIRAARETIAVRDQHTSTGGRF